MQRFLHPPQVRFARKRAKPHTRLRDRERHHQAVPKLNDDRFLLDPGKRSLLAGNHSAHPVGGIYDGITDSQPHTQRVAAASLIQPQPAATKTTLVGAQVQAGAAMSRELQY